MFTLERGRIAGFVSRRAVRIVASLFVALLIVGNTGAAAAAVEPPGNTPTSAVTKAPKLGRPISQEALAELGTNSIYPDGRGLPQGHGSIAEGAALYQARCQNCHGESGRGGSGGHLIAGEPIAGEDADAGIDNYWPYATTLFDYTRRAMPPDAPGSLTSDEAYALCAYLLNLAGIVPVNAVMTRETLPQVRMPNRDGFVWIDAAKPASVKPTARP